MEVEQKDKIEDGLVEWMRSRDFTSEDQAKAFVSAAAAAIEELNKDPKQASGLDPMFQQAAMSASDSAKSAVTQGPTPESIESLIAWEYFFTADEATQSGPVHECLQMTTFCILILSNGFVVTGESHCLNPEKFDAHIGEREARKSAVNKIFELEGYRIKATGREGSTHVV